MPGNILFSIKSNPAFALTRATLGLAGTGARPFEESDGAIGDAVVCCLDSRDIPSARGSGATALAGVDFNMAETLEWIRSRYTL